MMPSYTNTFVVSQDSLSQRAYSITISFLADGNTEGRSARTRRHRAWSGVLLPTALKLWERDNLRPTRTAFAFRPINERRDSYAVW